MIKAVVHDHLMNGRVLAGTRVLVHDKFDNPVALVMEMPDGSVVTSHWADPEWNTILYNLGVKKTLIVHDVPNVPLDQVRFDH